MIKIDRIGNVETLFVPPISVYWLEPSAPGCRRNGFCCNRTCRRWPVVCRSRPRSPRRPATCCVQRPVVARPPTRWRTCRRASWWAWRVGRVAAVFRGNPRSAAARYRSDPRSAAARYRGDRRPPRWWPVRNRDAWARCPDNRGRRTVAAATDDRIGRPSAVAAYRGAVGSRPRAEPHRGGVGDGWWPRQRPVARTGPRGARCSIVRRTASN